MNIFKFLTVLCVSTGGSICDSVAAPIAISNAGFEADTLPNMNPIPDNTFRVDPGTPSSWDAYDPNGILNGNNLSIGLINPTGSTFFPGGAPEGSLAAIVYLQGAYGSGEVGIQQTLADTLELKTRYTLQVDVGNIDSGQGSPSSADGGAVFYNLNGFPGYRIDLMAGDQVIASDTGAEIGEGLWVTREVTIDIGDSHPLEGADLRIRLVNLNIADAPDPGIEVDFDDVRLEATSLITAFTEETVYFDVPDALEPDPIPAPTGQLAALANYPDDADRLTLVSRVYVPDPLAHGPGPYPTVLILHGSGGLWSNNMIANGLISQFEQWGELLADLGYLVCFPDSYNPRGIPGNFSGRMPHHDPMFDDALCSPNYERPKDVVASLTYLQGRSDVDTEKIALMGFSHGAQTAMNAVLDSSVDLINYTVTYVSEGGSIQEPVDSPVRIPNNLPFPKLGFFYYGGGSHYRYHGSANSISAGRYMFDRRMQVMLFHGTEDSLMGVDDPDAALPLTGNLFPIKQVVASSAQAAAEGVDDPLLHHFIYDGVEHSFDLEPSSLGIDWDTNNESVDQKAKRLSREEVLKWLEACFKPATKIEIGPGVDLQEDIELTAYATNSRLNYQWEDTLDFEVDWQDFSTSFDGSGDDMVTDALIGNDSRRFFRLRRAAIAPPFDAIENDGFYLQYADFSY
ncbi:dienelactone hydrolase family protein [Haloferula sp.]|uniref:dienelactone hydrolase family protein n=1 Tax=Haloferula sp. TaxID=2497595 RepID=UPI00329EBCFC